METVSPALVTDLHAGALPELAGDGRLSFEVLGRALWNRGVTP